MVNVKNITLCADDFGFSEEVSQGIIRLIEKKRLTATSCMTTTPYWETHALMLLPHLDQIDIGLHVNLTDGKPLSSKWSAFPSHFNLVKKCYLSTQQVITSEIIYDEMKKQLLAFQKKIGRLPDYIDGHRHVHALPVVRECLLQLYKDYFPDHNCYIRIPGNTLAKTLKQNSIRALPIYLSGCYGLKKQLIKKNIPHNQSFNGVYDFKKSKNYRSYFQQFLSRAESNTLVMCHPGLNSAKAWDGIANSRVDEFNYLISDEFLKDCDKYHVVLSRLNRRA